MATSRKTKMTNESHEPERPVRRGPPSPQSTPIEIQSKDQERDLLVGRRLFDAMTFDLFEGVFSGIEEILLPRLLMGVYRMEQQGLAPPSVNLAARQFMRITHSETQQKYVQTAVDMEFLSIGQHPTDKRSRALRTTDKLRAHIQQKMREYLDDERDFIAAMTDRQLIPQDDGHFEFDRKDKIPIHRSKYSRGTR